MGLLFSNTKKLFIMKKNVNRYRLFIAAAFFTMSTAFVPAANAAIFTGADPVELKLVSQKNESRIFQLVISNAEAVGYKVIIRDENNTVLYADKLKGANLSRKFELTCEDAQAADTVLSFEVTNLATGKSVVYKINTVSRTARETEITIAQ
jgi:hypothetical protein